MQENPYDGGNGWWVPQCQKQPMVDEELVAAAARRVDKAIFILCRSVGESYDCTKDAGSWYLSEAEEHTIALLSKHFDHLIVVVNGGNIIDMSWVKKYNVGTVLYAWQGGQEGGAATVDTLMGDTCPGGRLTDTVAAIEDYPSTECFGGNEKNIHREDIFVGYRYFETFAPDRVIYPFGYGLSYTTFESKLLLAEKQGDGDRVTLSVSVRNTGAYSGREVVEVYASAPCGKLGKPARELVTFQKTRILAPGEEQILDLEFDIKTIASYDDSGDSGFPYAYVLEAGEYGVYVGKNVRDAQRALTFTVEETRLVRQCTQALAPTEAFKRMTAKGGVLSFEDAPLSQYDVRERVARELPPDVLYTGDRGIMLADVKAGKYTLDEFIAQFSAEELMYIIRGEGMSSPKAPVPGTAGCFGGMTRVWNDKGVPVITTCDGPSGVRMESAAKATCIPVGTLLACTWDPELLHELFDSFADELIDYSIDVVLAPGINIHRSPLCGRNFEYFSEDPLLTGAFATKIAERFTRKGVYCTIKHFAVNSQETGRRWENEILSERALREIYLRGFERAVRSGYVRSIMTAYNKVNGISTGACYDLTTTILRGEWGYDSFVMTDWGVELMGLRSRDMATTNLADMVKAQNDVYMCIPDATTYPDDMQAAFDEGYLTLGELQRCAKNLVRFSMETLAFRQNRKSEVESLSACSDRICEIDLTDEPYLPYELPENRYESIPRQRVTPALPADGFYCVEMTYRIGGDALEQHNIVVYMDNAEPISLTVTGTDGKPRTLRFKMYVTKNPTIYLEGEGFVGFAIYSL